MAYSTGSRFEEDDPPDKQYHCNYCNKSIGGRDKIYSKDKHDRVSCSQGCALSISSHWSREHEWRGDY